VLVERDAPTDQLSAVPEARDAAATAAWIRRALAGEVPVPPSITAQVAACVRAARGLRA
jgi:anthranilate phosphoribosyltransferase